MIIKFNLFEGERYQTILKGYGKDYDTLVSKRGHTPDKVTGSFTHLPSNDLAEDLLEKYYKPGFKLLDIGCGMGNILKLGSEIGYQSTGLEINENLKKYHNGLDVIYGDVLNMNLNFMKNFDVIYLYRPIGPLDKCNILFQKIYENCKYDCKIIYVFPSQLKLGLKRKFQFELFPVIDWVRDEKTGQKSIMGDTGRITDRPYDRKNENYYSVLTPLKRIKDINVEEILKKSINVLSKYRAINGDYPNTERSGSRFISSNINDMDDFLNRLEKSYNLIKNNNLDIKFHHNIMVEYSETEEVYNRLKASSSLGNSKYYQKFDPAPKKETLSMSIWKMDGVDIGIEDESKPKLDVINSIKRDLERMKKYKLKLYSLSVVMSYSKIDNEIYQYISYFGN